MALVFLSLREEALTLFTVTTTLIYFAFLREKTDFLVFPIALLAPFVIVYFSTENPDLAYFFKVQFQLWIHLAWGLTAVSANKAARLAVKSTNDPL